MSKRIVLSFILMTIVLLFASVGMAQAATIYVNCNSINPIHDGQSWGTALNKVQDGVNAANSGDEVWVARGTYLENITLKDGVALFGGFTGLETTRDQRDFKANETILDGRQAGSVIKMSYCGSNTRIDGFTIKNGNGTPLSYGYRYGGGIYCYGGSPVIVDNIITGNVATESGGGIFCVYAAPTIVDNTVTGNKSAHDCGGIIVAYSADCSTTISNNYISGNSGAWGGGISVNAGGKVTHNTIIGNSAYAGGGGIFCTTPLATISNNYLAENAATDGSSGGAIYCWQGGSTITSNIIVNNSGGICGGIFSDSQMNGGSEPTKIANNVIVGNYAEYEGIGGAGAICACNYMNDIVVNNVIAFNSSGVSTGNNSSISMSNNDLYGNTNFDYLNVAQGPGDIFADPLLADRANGDYHLQAGSPCIDAGDDSAIQPGWVDMDGESCIIGAHVDIGADEFLSDTILPTVWAAPAHGIYNTPQSVILTTSEPGSIYYTLDSSTPTTSSALYEVGTPIVIATSATLKFMAVDTAGNTSTVGSEDYIIDPTAPEEMHLCLCGQLGNNDWFTTPVQFGIAATDSISGIANKQYSFDNQNWNTFNEASGPITLTEDQTVTIYYRATDNAGNTTTSATGHEVKIDKTAPITAISLAGTAGTNGWFVSDVTVTLSAWDNLSGVAKTEYSFDGSTWTTYTVPFAVTDEGITTVYYRSIDMAGNTETTQTQPLQVDPTPPPAEITVTPAPGSGGGGTGGSGGGGWYTGPVEVTGTAGPDTSTIVSTEYSWDCNTWFTHDGPLTITDDGTWICYYKAVDGAGNVTIKSVTVKIDKTKPVSTLTIGDPKQLIPGTEGIYRIHSTTPLSITGYDPPGAIGAASSGLAKIEYKIDDGAWVTRNVSEADEVTFTVPNGVGERIIYYHAIDIAGNVETDNATTVVVNSAPAANDANVSTDEDTLVDITLEATDADSDTLTYTIIDSPTHGTLSVLNGNKVTYTPNSNYNGTDSLTFKANDGSLDSNVATVSITVNPVNDAPIANDGSAMTDEDVPVDVSLQATDIDGDALTYRIVSAAAHGTLSLIAGNQLTYTPDANYNGNDSFTFVANDGTVDSNLGHIDITVNPVNDAPTVSIDQSSVMVDEGQQAVNTGAYSDIDGDNVTLSASVGTITNNADGTFSWSYDALDGPLADTVTVTAGDSYGGQATASFGLTVNNVKPSVGTITAPIDPVAANTTLTASAIFTDPGILDTHSATWDWGDGTTSDGIVTENNGSGSAMGTHIYTTAGIYTITLTVTDKDGASDTRVCQQYVVVYDPSAGYVTGGGWINSPAGAYVPDPTLTGKATFGFVSRYPKGATTPTGNTEFHFEAGNLNFHAASDEWLTVSGAKAQYKGSGTINGSGDYGFLLSAIDGQIKNGDDVDTFRIKIWDRATGNTVYDNQMGASDKADPTTALGGGSIIIHTK